MILRYGNYQHSIAEASVVIQRTPLFNDGGVQYGFTERWDVEGMLQAATQADLMNAIAGMQSAYLAQGLDLGLFLDDGETLTSHYLLSANALGGVRVVEGPSFPEGRGAEAGLFRSYRIRLEADVPDASVAFLSWEETVTQTGGGPQFILLQTLNGPPQRQQVAQATPCHAVQSGRAVGHFAYPSPPLPLWPAAEHLDQRQIVRRSPRRHGEGGNLAYSEFEITWQYVFEAPATLAGLPHFWIKT